MKDFVLFTDSACDIAPSDLKKWGVEYCVMSFTFRETGQECDNYELTAGEFYRRMREGSTIHTAAINQAAFEQYFRRFAAEGKDVIYIGFSSGLSSTYSVSRLAAETVMEEYPGVRIYPVDSLSASAGMGMLVYLAVQKKNAGASAEKTAAYLEDIRHRICHWFMVDDLKYLKNGGRLSAAAAAVGSLIGIRPMLNFDDEGHLIFRYAARGRKAAIRALAEEYGKGALTPGEGVVFVNHADCTEDVNRLKELLKNNYGVEVRYTADIGPVIGGHVGPGTMSVFYIGKER